jgi:hypothetical protein
MTSRNDFARLIRVAGFAALALGGACAKDKGTVMDSASGSSAPAVTALSVMDVDMGRHIGADKQISDKTDDFAPADTIYGSVHTMGSASGATIAGKWTFENGTTVDEQSQTISPTGDAYTEFHIVKAGGWPKGKYTLHVMLDGKEVRTKDVTVK